MSPLQNGGGQPESQPVGILCFLSGIPGFSAVFGKRPAEFQGHLQFVGQALHPRGQVLRQQACAVVSPQPGPGGAVQGQLRPGAGQQVVAQDGQLGLQLQDEDPARLSRRGLGGTVPGHRMGPVCWGRAAAPYTTAPALGSFGSCSLPGLALTRSSRLTPSHMAMPAATKMEE